MACLGDQVVGVAAGILITLIACFMAYTWILAAEVGYRRKTHEHVMTARVESKATVLIRAERVAAGYFERQSLGLRVSGGRVPLPVSHASRLAFVLTALGAEFATRLRQPDILQV